jgi:glyoxylase I family protein
VIPRRPNLLDNAPRGPDFFPMKITRLHHVAVIGSDYQRSKHFYTEVLGLAVLAETFRAERRSYKLDLALPGGGQIELFSFANPPPRPSRPEACGLRHLALEVADIVAAVEFIQGQGIAVEAIRLDELTGKRYTFFADPDGLPIEFYEC